MEEGEFEVVEMVLAPKDYVPAPGECGCASCLAREQEKEVR